MLYTNLKTHMKKVFLSLVISVLFSVWVFAYTQHNIESANFLAEKEIINDNSNNIADYNLWDHITRREMLKVMMNLSWKSVPDTCVWSFSDMSSSDWGCKYAESALREWYIAGNTSFRPNDNVTLIEALKMIMQAKNIPRDANADWRAWYVSKGQSQWLVDDGYFEYNANATRGWIFSTSARSYSDFDYVESEVELDPEVEELFESLLGL